MLSLRPALQNPPLLSPSPVTTCLLAFPPSLTLFFHLPLTLHRASLGWGTASTVCTGTHWLPDWLPDSLTDWLPHRITERLTDRLTDIPMLCRVTKKFRRNEKGWEVAPSPDRVGFEYNMNIEHDMVVFCMERPTNENAALIWVFSISPHIHYSWWLRMDITFTWFAVYGAVDSSDRNLWCAVSTIAFFNPFKRPMYLYYEASNYTSKLYL